jgi:Flp pilus assembly protein TadD
MDKLEIKYRTHHKGLPPQPIRMNIPGWGGSPDMKMENGSEPQAWHCLPLVEGMTYGIELVYQYETECHVINDKGETRFEWDYAREPGGIVGPNEFGRFAPKPPRFYSFDCSIDLQAPPGYVLRTQPHPRYFLDDSGTVPLALIGHVQTEWWPKKLFVVFRVPPPGQRHVFRKGEPYVQILFVPQRMNYETVRMSPDEEVVRAGLEEAIVFAKSHIARNVWFNPDGFEFSDHYKTLMRAYQRDGKAGVEEVVRAAVEQCQACLPRDRTIPECLELGLERQREGRNIEARTIYLHIMGRDPNNTEAANRLGILAMSMGLPKPGFNMLSRAVGLQPNSPAYRANLGESLRRLGRLAEAEAMFRTALQLAPNDPRVMSSLALTVAQQGRADEGLQISRAALTVDARVPEAHFALGAILAQQRQYAQARASFEAALALQPGFEDARRALEQLPAQQ